MRWFERWPGHCTLKMRTVSLSCSARILKKNENSFVKTSSICFLISCFLLFFVLLVSVLKTTNQTHILCTETCFTVLETENCFQNS
jgi:hypothetical protein